LHVSTRWLGVHYACISKFFVQMTFSIDLLRCSSRGTRFAQKALLLKSSWTSWPAKSSYAASYFGGYSRKVCLNVGRIRACCHLDLVHRNLLLFFSSSSICLSMYMSICLYVYMSIFLSVTISSMTKLISHIGNLEPPRGDLWNPADGDQGATFCLNNSWLVLVRFGNWYRRVSTDLEMVTFLPHAGISHPQQPTCFHAWGLPRSQSVASLSVSPA
jgi:hypothetical protein